MYVSILVHDLLLVLLFLINLLLLSLEYIFERVECSKNTYVMTHDKCFHVPFW